MSTFTYTASNEANLMKVKYGKLIEKQFNESSVMLGRLEIRKNFVGSQIEEPVEQSIGGGVGCGSLPTANENKIGKATITSKKMYATAQVDRETMKAMKEGEGAFVDATKYPVRQATRSFNRNLERMIVAGDATGSGLLATIDTTVTGSNPYVCTLTSGDLIEAIEEGDLVNIESGNTDLFEVTAVDPSSNKITVSRLTGTQIPDDTDGIYMQNSEDKEIFGIRGVLAATSGSLYGVTVGRRWKAYQKNAAGALTTDLMNDVVLNVKKQCGESPNLILTSYKQYIKLLNLLEDQKTYNLPTKSKDFKGQISFSGVEYVSADGTIPVFPSRFMKDAEMFFLNDMKIKMHLRPEGFKWFDEDGTVFLRDASADSYSARYGAYGQLFVNPHFHGYLYGLT
jgi:hypothetical protein